MPIPGFGLQQTYVLGLADLLFAALFLSIAWRWSLHLSATAIAIIASVPLTLVASVELLGGAPVPALPAIVLAFLLVNVRPLWLDWRRS